MVKVKKHHFEFSVSGKPDDLEAHLIESFYFLVPGNKTLTILELAKLVDNHFSNAKAKYLVTHVNKKYN